MIKRTVQSSGPSFAYIGLFSTVYQSPSTLNSHSWNEEEASDANRHGCEPSRRNHGSLWSGGASGQRATKLQLDYCTLTWLGFPSLWFSVSAPFGRSTGMLAYSSFWNILLFPVLLEAVRLHTQFKVILPGETNSDPCPMALEWTCWLWLPSSPVRVLPCRQLLSVLQSKQVLQNQAWGAKTSQI